MNEDPDEDTETHDRFPPTHPERPQWLDGPIQPSPVDAPTGPPSGLPLSQTGPRPPLSSDDRPLDAAVRQRSSGWLKPGLAGGVVGAVVAAAMAGGIVAASDDRDTGYSPAPRAAVSRPSSRLADGGLNVGEVLAAVEKGVVSIKVQGIQTDGLRTGVFEAAGSGMVIEPTGLVLTNAHVVNEANKIAVLLSDGRELPADLVSSAPSRDVALLQIRGGSDFDVVTLGASKELEVGDAVVAVGNALNLGATPTVTTGIVSALNRSIDAGARSQVVESLDQLIQTDAAINQGNSGGPLVNAAGQVVGINTAVAAEGQNIGFALSIDSVKPLIERLRAGNGEVVAGPFLGVSTVDLALVVPQVVDRLGITRTDGAFVQQVVPGSGAEAAGLQPGDVITQVNGRSVKEAADLVGIIQDRAAGDTIEIGFERRGQSRRASATLGSRGVPRSGG
jgi:S1-C subfamily serine protease